MASSIEDRLNRAVRPGYGMKTPALCASTANVSLTAPSATFDGVTPSSGDRILLWQQTDNTQNGIYEYGASGLTRALDFDGNSDVVFGTLIPVSTGTLYTGKIAKVTSTGSGNNGGINFTGSSTSDAISFSMLSLFAVSVPLTGASTSLQTVSTGSKTFSVPASRAWEEGTRLRMSSTDISKIMEGTVTSYSGSSSVVLTVDLLVAGGAGSTDSWNLTVAGVQGSSGATGATGSSGADGATFDISAKTAIGAFASTLFFAVYASCSSTTYKMGSSAIAFMETTDQQFSGGGNITSRSRSTGSLTVNYGAGPLQFVTGSTAAWTITASTKDGSCILTVTNPIGPVAPTFSGFSTDTNTGNAVSTSSGGKYKLYFDTVSNLSSYLIRTLST